MNRNQKRELVSTLHSLFGENAIVIVVHYNGMTVAEISTLRALMREVGAGLKVIKNRLTRLAVAGTSYEGLASLFVGPTAIAYSHDPVITARVVAKYAKSNSKLILLGGGLGITLLSPDELQALADLPSLGELRTRLVIVIKTPATITIGMLRASAEQLARVFKAYENMARKTA